MAELIATDLYLKVKGRALIRNASLSLGPGEFVALIGPNGAGKTSLIRAALGLERPSSGSATLDGKDTWKLGSIERARKIAYLPQIRSLAWPNRVRDVVSLGRYSYGVGSGKISIADSEAIETAISDCDLALLADRQADTLSGGELARMHCARAFATQAPLLIADEPIAALDPRHQFRILDLIAAFVDRGGGALIVLHDIQLATRYASRLVWMKEGVIVASGTPEETLSSERLSAVYGVNARVTGLNVEMIGANNISQ